MADGYNSGQFSRISGLGYAALRYFFHVMPPILFIGVRRNTKCLTSLTLQLLAMVDHISKFACKQLN